MKPIHAVVMGVSGCGKSEVGQRIAAHLALPLIEGDAFHPAGNIDKMRRGLALTDEDRAGWLQQLAAELLRHPQGAVLACSALKASYRDVLRASTPGLCFVHLALTEQQALERVAKRPGHFYPPSLVASQFEALENPSSEPDALVLDAVLPPEAIASAAANWLTLRATDDAAPNSTIRN